MGDCVDLIAEWFYLDVGTVFQIEGFSGYFKFDHKDLLLWRYDIDSDEWIDHNEYILADLIAGRKHIKPRELLTDAERTHIKNIVEMYGHDVWEIRKVKNSKDTQKLIITYDYGEIRDPLDSFEVSDLVSTENFLARMECQGWLWQTEKGECIICQMIKRLVW